MLLFGSEQALTSAVLSVVELMRSGAPHPYATAPRFTVGFCPRGCNRCLWPRTRTDVHTAATCPGIRLLPATLPVRITVGSEGFAEIGKDGAAEPRSVPTSAAPPGPGVPPPPPAPMDVAAHSAAPSRPAPSLGAEGDSAASATPARDELGLPPMSPAARPPTHALPPVSATGSQSARAVDHPSTPKRRSTRTMTPSSRGLEFIADRAGSASPAKTRRPPDSEPESCSDADTAGGGPAPPAPGGARAKRKRARIKQHTPTTTTSPSK